MGHKYIFYGLLTSFLLTPAITYAQWVQMTPQYGTNVRALARDGMDVFAGVDNGVFVSTDGGATWNPSGLSGLTVRAVYLLNSNVYAGTDSGVFVSTDTGLSWKLTGMADTSVTAICSVGSQLLAGTRGQGIFVSADSGVVWKLAGEVGKVINALAIDGSKVLATAAYAGLFVSSDSGKTWNASNSGLATTNVGPLLVDSSNTYLGTDIGVFVSTDSGMTWNARTTGWAGGQVTALASGKRVLIAGTMINGIYYSSDSGASWNRTNLRSWSNPWSITNFGVLAFCGSDTTLFAGSMSGGVFCSTDNGVTWLPQGLNSSAVRALTMDGKDLFEGTNTGGIFRSTDDGATWTSANKGITWPGIFSFAMRGSEIFTSTQTDLGGVYRSTDYGNTWALTGLQGRQIYSLDANDSLLLAGGPAGANYTGGIIISTDNGLSWVQSFYSSGISGTNSVTIGDTNLFATDISGNNIFVSADQGKSWIARTGEGGSCVAVIGRSVFVGAWYNAIGFLSTDNGVTWTQTTTPGNIYALAVSNDTLYAATNHGVFASFDLGQTWGDVSTNAGHAWFWSLAIGDGYLFAGSSTGQVWRRPLSQISILAPRPVTLVSPPNDSTIMPDSVKCVWNSVPGVASYRLQIGYDSGFNNVFFEASQIKDTSFEVGGLRSATTFYWRVTENDSSGLVNWSRPWEFRTGPDTTNQGKGWVNLGSLGYSAVRTLNSHNTNLFAGTNYEGLFLSTNNGLTWEREDVGLSDYRVSSIAANDSDVFVGTYQDTGGVAHAGVYRSTDGGKTWLPTPLLGREIYCLAANDTFVLAGGPAGTNYSGGLFISANSGVSWTLSIDRGGLGINSVVIGDTNFFATDLNNLGIFVSTDYGNTWRSQNGGSSVAAIGRTIFVGAFYDSIGFLSQDNGASWIRTVTPGDIYGLATNNGDIFAATDHGVFASADLGASWIKISTGLTNMRLWCVTASNGYLFVGSDSGYVWRRPLAGILTGIDVPTEGNLPKSFKLGQNYPNPFNPSTTISFDLREISAVRIEIYDMLGQRVESSDLGTLAAGTYRQVVDMSRYASGVYLYKIEALGSDGQRFISIKKMMLVK